jgi:hypothetical protein
MSGKILYRSCLCWRCKWHQWKYRKERFSDRYTQKHLITVYQINIGDNLVLYQCEHKKQKGD